MGWFIPFFLVFGLLMIGSLSVGLRYPSTWETARIVLTISAGILASVGIWMALDGMRLIRAWQQEDSAPYRKREL